MDDIRIDADQYLSEIIEHLPDPAFVINLEGKVIAWNEAIAEMTKVKAGDMLGKGDYEYALPFYGVRTPVLIDYAIRNDINVDDRYDYIKKENDTMIAEVYIPQFQSKGIYLWSKASPLYDSNHNVAGSIQVIRDITERKLMESELRNSEERYRAIFENSGTAIVVVGEDLKILMTNSELLKIAFYSKEEVVGKSQAEFVVDRKSVV
jgi:PAS domain-containing protein